MKEKITYNKSHKSWILNVKVRKSDHDKALVLEMALHPENVYEMNYTHALKSSNPGHSW